MCRLWLVLLSFAASACAFASSGAKPLAPFLPPPAPEDNVTYYIEVSSSGLGSGGLRYVDYVYSSLDRLLPGSQRVTSSSVPQNGHFLSVRLIERGPNEILSVLWFVGSVSFGACMIPVALKTQYLLEAELFRDGQSVRQYRYQNHVRDWCLFLGYFAIPKFRVNSEVVYQSVITNLVDGFLGDFSKDFP